jgi:ferritin
MRRALELFDLMGTEGLGLKLLDERIPQIRDKRAE